MNANKKKFLNRQIDKEDIWKDEVSLPESIEEFSFQKERVDFYIKEKFGPTKVEEFQEKIGFSSVYNNFERFFFDIQCVKNKVSVSSQEFRYQKFRHEIACVITLYKVLFRSLVGKERLRLVIFCRKVYTKFDQKLFVPYLTENHASVLVNRVRRRINLFEEIVGIHLINHKSPRFFD